MADEESIVIRYRPMVEGLARKFRVESKLIDCDDLVSEGLLAVVRCVREFDDSKGNSLTRFVRSRVRGRMIDLIRKANYRQGWETEESEDNGAGAPIVEGHESRVVTSTRYADLLREELTPLENTCIVDRFWRLKTMREIDDLRGFIPGTARKICARAMEKLRDVGIDAFYGD